MICFPNSKITHSSVLKEVPTPTGDTSLFSFEISGHPFMAINAGPLFRINPSISLMVNFDPSRDPQAREHLDELWKKLEKGGKARMALGEYPFSKRYGWIEDRFGLNWQLILTNPQGEPRPLLIPSLMFTRQMAGRAEEAIDFYCSIFKDGKRGFTARYPRGAEPDKEGTLTFADFNLLGTWFGAMDSAQPHEFSFNEAVSLLVPCDNQDEIDYYWGKLSADPQSGTCGWIKDKFGVSWQIWPKVMGEMMAKGKPDQIGRMTQAFLKMKKFNVAELQKAFAGK